MKKTTLLIMAAGIGSRYGGGIKQLATVDNAGHIIVDYSVHDAIAAGFDKIVFIIRRDIEADFNEVIGDRIREICARYDVEVSCCFQDLLAIPGRLPEGRKKPWGTGQAVLTARDEIDGPFAVINADDYYGKQAFRIIHDWLVSEREQDNEYCMAGFVMKNTLSDNGGVTRGICQVADGYLTGIEETRNIVRTADGAETNGRVLDVESIVSMNMWGMDPAFMDVLEENFRVFFRESVPADPMKSEYLLPVLIGELLQKQKAAVRVLPTDDRWFGVTYAEDRLDVMRNFGELIESGEYRLDLFADL